MQRINKVLSYISVFLVPFYFFRFAIFKVNTNVFEIVVFILFVFTLIGILRGTIKSKGRARDYYIPFLILLLVFLSIFVGGFSLDAAGIFKGWFLVPIVLAWSIIQNFERDEIYKISFPIYLALQVVAISAILQRLDIFTTYFYQNGDSSFGKYLSENRAFGFFESPNYLAMFLAPMFFLSLPILEHIKNKLLGLACALSLILPILALFFSSSRAGIVAFVISLFVYLNYRYLNKREIKKINSLHAGLLVFGLLAVYFSYIFFATRFFAPQSGGDSVRIEIYKYSVEMIKSHPILGVGLGKFQEQISILSSQDIAFQEYGLKYALHPHNLLMAIWLDLGFFGLILFIWLLASIVKNIFNSNSHIRASLIAALVAIIVHGLFDTTYFKNDLSAIFWIVFAESLLLKNIKSDEDK